MQAKWKKGLLAAGAVVVAGAGAAWLLLGGLDQNIPPDEETKPILAMEASAEPAPSASMSPISQTPDGEFALFTGSEQGGHSIITIERKDGTRQTYDWPFVREWGEASPLLKYSDLNNDGTDELVVHWTGIASDGEQIENLRVIDTENFNEYTMPLIEELLTDRIDSKVTPLDGYAWVELIVDEQRFQKVLGGQPIEGWGDHINVGRKLTFHIQEQPNRTYAIVELYAGGGKPGVKLGNLEIDLMVEPNDRTGAEELLTIKPNAIQYLPVNTAVNEIPLLAIKTGDDYVALQDWDDQKDLKQLLGEPSAEQIKQLGEDAGTYQGMYVKTLAYDGMEMTMNSPNGERFYVVNMKVNGPAYSTSLGITVGDPAALVLEKYPNAIIAKDGRKPPDNFAYAVSEDFYMNLYIDIKEGIVNELYYEYLLN
ncbi:hypothetical protein ACX93W_03630 [Paenibacillus sp. CAU 1782]